MQNSQFTLFLMVGDIHRLLHVLVLSILLFCMRRHIHRYYCARSLNLAIYVGVAHSILLSEWMSASLYLGVWHGLLISFSASLLSGLWTLLLLAATTSRKERGARL